MVNNKQLLNNGLQYAATVCYLHKNLCERIKLNFPVIFEKVVFMEVCEDGYSDASKFETTSMPRDAFLQILFRLYQLEESVPFKQSINLLGSVSNSLGQPMNLIDVETKLKENQYSEPWLFLKDMWMIFENAWMYNRESSKVYKCCSILANEFEDEANKVMKSIGYCCGRWYTFDPMMLDCNGQKSCCIPKNMKYYDYKKKYTVCVKCFQNAKGSSIYINNSVLCKDQFVEMKNDKSEEELFVTCCKCGKRFHQICVLYVEQIQKNRFVCECCETDSYRKMKLLEEYSAKRLVVTKLSQYLETQVENFLRTEKIVSSRITIRVISSSKKMTQVKKQMKERFVTTGKLSESFPFIAKTIFVFQEHDGTDVCIFGMHLQEYGSSCPRPNSRRIYLSYIDSVNYFQPRQFRTYVYYEILLAYLEYVKQLGYMAVHVWACPPPEGDDYLFYRHPKNQKSPDYKRLDEWYSNLLQRGIAKGIVLHSVDFLKKIPKQDDLESLIFETPYFENDFWPNILEEGLEQIQKQSEKEDKCFIANECSDSPNHSPELIRLGIYLRKRICAVNEEQKEVFFVFLLHPEELVQSLRPIIDPDPLINRQLMENRDTFLIMCREQHLEFSSLRRAKYSTLILLYELHSCSYEKEKNIEFIYTCNSCDKKITAGYHCPACNDFDLCASCWNRNGHCHEMELLNSSKKVDRKQIDHKIQSNPEDLSHACLCKDKSCIVIGCAHLKRIFSHFKRCEIKIKSTCPLCQELLQLCWRHAKFCQNQNCEVPICNQIKRKLSR